MSALSYLGSKFHRLGLDGGLDAASTIHHALGELHAVNQWVDDHGVLVLRGHKVWVVRPVPSYCNLRPARVLGDWGRVAIRILREVFYCQTVGVPRKVW